MRKPLTWWLMSEAGKATWEALQAPADWKPMGEHTIKHARLPIVLWTANGAWALSLYDGGRVKVFTFWDRGPCYKAVKNLARLQLAITLRKDALAQAVKGE